MTSNKNMKNRKMRVWWYPNIPTSDTFYIPVETEEEAKKILDVLAYYDCFLMNQSIRGDYCNCGGLEVFNEETADWEGWYYEDEENYYEDLDEYIKAKSSRYDSLNVASKAMSSQVHFD